MAYAANAIEFITRLSTDTLLLVFLIFGFFVATTYFGKNWSVSFIFSLFISNILYTRIPFELPLENSWYEFGTIIFIALLVSVVLKRFIASDFPYKKSRKYTQSIIISILVVITLMTTGLTEAYTFAPFISRWFTGDFQFWASLIPLIILFFIIKK